MHKASMVGLAAMLTVGSAAASAQAVKAVDSVGIELGAVAGDAYYTVEPDGDHVVVTLAPRGGAGTPVRFEATLAEGQAVTLSSPDGYGAAPARITLARDQHGVRLLHADRID